MGGSLSFTTVNIDGHLVHPDTGARYSITAITCGSAPDPARSALTLHGELTFTGMCTVGHWIQETTGAHFAITPLPVDGCGVWHHPSTCACC